MRIQAFTISFLLAFLLFAVQPMATKMVLPTLGGTPAVWNTVMFTFQLLLLAGYLYAHLLTHWFNTRGQMLVHGALILGTFLFLPLAVHLTTSDALVTHPIFYLIQAFLLQLGLPFFCLAATAPLLQSWVSRSPHPLSKTPYVLYSASNLGSFAGLLGYVGVVEPLLDLSQQSHGWSALYIAGMLVLLLTGIRLRPAEVKTEAEVDMIRPDWRTRLQWIGLAFLPSSLSLGVTTYIATDVASIPLLWVIPLSLYLLSFVDAFRTRPLFVAGCQKYAPLFGILSLVIYGAGIGIVGGYLFQLLSFAVLAIAIHGWLALRQPATRYLTQFYVCLSVGGALGGVLNGLVAPLVFRSAMEYPIVLLIATLVSFILIQRRLKDSITDKAHLHLAAKVAGQTLLLTVVLYGLFLWLQGPADFAAFNSWFMMKSAAIAGVITLALYRRPLPAFYICISVVMVLLTLRENGLNGYRVLFRDRNFFGVSRVYENPQEHAHYFLHDTTLHGIQLLDPKRAMTPLAYYAPLKEAFQKLPTTHRHAMGVIGLGVGTVKCFAAPHQPVDLYEINPMVKDLAENPAYFTYLRDCPGDGNVLLGDGRIRISEQPDGRYGIIIIDAFSSDAIPSHLLTREAFATYLDKLAPGGVILMNTTNRHINLWPLLGAQVKTLGAVGYGKFFQTDGKSPLLFNSYWVAIAKNDAALAPMISGDPAWGRLEDGGHRPWTDQYINLLPYFKALQ